MVTTLPSDFDIFSSVKRRMPLWVQIRANSWPRALDWASSFSWWGKTRSSPPPWISNTGPRSSSAMTEHSMCQPGRPRTPGRVPRCVLPGLFAFQSAKSRASSLSGFGSCSSTWSGRCPDSRPYLESRGDAEVHVSFDRVRVLALDQLLDEADDLGNHLARLRLVVGHPEAETAGVLEVPRRHLLGELGARAWGGLVDLVVDVRDVVDERRLVPALSQPVPEPHPDDEGARVPDVGPRIDGRAAEVHTHRPGRIG